MSRNGSGIYNLPTVYKAETGDVIVADQHNTPLEDIRDDLNAARPVVAGGTGATTASGARTALSVPSISDVQTGYVPRVATKTALSALDTASFKAAVLTEATREKLWMWKTGDFSTEEAGDTDHVNYIAADGVSTALGCWVAATGDGVTVRTIAAGGTGADNASDARDNLGLGSAATTDASAYATAAQGALADSALQDASAFATAAQGALADGAVQSTATDASTFGFVNAAGPLADSGTTVPAESVAKAYADTKLAKASDLSDLSSISTARTNLGIEVQTFADVTAAQAATIPAATKTIIVGGENFIRVTTDYAGLGPDIAIDGGFDNPGSWIAQTGWTVSGGVASRTVGAANTVFTSSPTIAGALYFVSFEIVSISAGSFVAYLGGGVGTYHSSTGTFSDVVIPATTGATGIAADASAAGSVDNFSIRALPGSSFQSADGQWWGPKAQAYASDLDSLSLSITKKGGLLYRENMGGTHDLGTVFSVMAHTGPNNAIGSGLWPNRDSSPPKPGVLGFSSDSDIATYQGVDTVAMYADTVGPALAGTASGTFTATTFTPSSALASDTLARMYVGQWVRAETSLHWGKITDFDANSITVSGWYVNGDVSSGQVPSGTQTLDIGVVTSVWVANLVALLGPNSVANSALIAEIDIANYKGAYNVTDGGPNVGGINACSIGTYNGAFGFLASRSAAGAKLERGFIGSGCNFSAFEVTDWNSLGDTPEYGFLYNIEGTGNAFTIGTSEGNNIKFNVNAAGAVFASDNVGFGVAPVTNNRLVLKGYGAAGSTNLLLCEDSLGNAVFTIRDNGLEVPRGFTVSQLTAMTGLTGGTRAWASNGRRGGQGAGAGTGVWAWYDSTAATWIAFDTGGALAA